MHFVQVGKVENPVFWKKKEKKRKKHKKHITKKKKLTITIKSKKNGIGVGRKYY